MTIRILLTVGIISAVISTAALNISKDGILGSGTDVFGYETTTSERTVVALVSACIALILFLIVRCMGADYPGFRGKR